LARHSKNELLTRPFAFLTCVVCSRSRVTCPSCRDERPVKLPEGVADLSAAATVSLIPQNSDTIQLLKRSKQLETALQEQWVQVQVQTTARCACGADCAAPATFWCGECDGELCVEHDAALHAAALSAHKRIRLSEKVADRQAKLGAALIGAGSKLKSEIRSAVQRLETAIALKEAEQSSNQRALIDLRSRLAGLQAAAAQLDGMSDVEAQRLEGAFDQLLQPLPLLISSSGIYHSQSRPVGSLGLLQSLSDDQFGHLQRFLANGPLVANSCTQARQQAGAVAARHPLTHFLCSDVRVCAWSDQSASAVSRLSRRIHGRQLLEPLRWQGSHAHSRQGPPLDSAELSHCT